MQHGSRLVAQCMTGKVLPFLVADRYAARQSLAKQALTGSQTGLNLHGSILAVDMHHVQRRIDKPRQLDCSACSLALCQPPCM